MSDLVGELFSRVKAQMITNHGLVFLRLRSHRSRLFGYTVYVFEGTRILEIKHYDFLIPGHIGGHYSKSSYRRV